MIDGLQLDIGCVNTDGGVDGQRQYKVSLSLCEDLDELVKSSFPNGPRQNFQVELCPDTTGSGDNKLRPLTHSLAICVASVCAFLDVFCDCFAELLHSSFDRQTIGGGLLGIFHMFQPTSRAIKEAYSRVKVYTYCRRTFAISLILKLVRWGIQLKYDFTHST